MCIAIFKNGGYDFLSMDLYEQCWDLNSDGASISYYDEKADLWRVRKGLMTWRAWADQFDNMRRSGELTKDQMVFIHFRVGTAGPKVKSTLTHPFPVTEDYDQMRQLEFETPNMIAQNGTLFKPDPKLELSDTMIATADYAAPLWDLIYTPTGLKKVKGKKIEDILMEVLDAKASRWVCFSHSHAYIYGPMKKNHPEKEFAWFYHDEWGHWFSNEDWTDKAGRQRKYGTTTAGFINRVRVTARHYYNIAYSYFCDEAGKWDWGKWSNYITPKVVKDHVNKDEKKNEGKNLITKLSVAAIMDMDGNVVWDEIDYNVEEDYLSCPICHSDECYETSMQYMTNTHVCANCGCVFDAADGETLGWDDNVHGAIEMFCPHCDKNTLTKGDSLCINCGAYIEIPIDDGEEAANE